MTRASQTVLSAAVSQAVVAAAFVVPISAVTLVLSGSAAQAADVDCPSPSTPTLTSGIYQVDDSSHLMWIRDDTTRWDDSYVVTTDIDMGACIWDAPIAPSAYGSSTPFSGVFDGGGFTVSNLSVEVNTKSIDDSSATLAGFIGYLDGGGTLRDITFDHAHVSLDDTTDYDDSVYNAALVKVGVAVALADDFLGGSTLQAVTVTNSTIRATLADVRLQSLGTNWRYSNVGGVAGEVWSSDVSGLTTSNNVVQNFNYQRSTGRSEAPTGGIIGASNYDMVGFRSTDDSVTAYGRDATAGGVIGDLWRGAVSDVVVAGTDVLALSWSEALAGGAIGTRSGDGASGVTVTGGAAVTQPVDPLVADPLGGWFQAGGAFAETDDGYIRDVKVSGTSVASEGWGFVNAGGVVGLAYDDTTALLSSDANVSAMSSGDDSSYVSAGGLIGYQWNSAPVSSSYASGNATAWSDDTGALVWAGGLVGYIDAGSLSDTYSTGSASATSLGHASSAESGGLVGATEGNISNSYSLGSVTATSADDTAGGLVGTVYAGTVTSSYWNTTTSGASTSHGGTGLTSAQMQDRASFAGWTIVDGWQAQAYSGSPALPTSPFWGQCDVNSGFPFLLWEYASSPCAVPPPPPSPTYPPSAPRDVTAMAGDKAATVSWSAPSSSGSFPISNYQVRSTPASDGCMTAELTCEITGLANGTAYTFEVRALNGAGWGPWSSSSESVTPGVGASIVITGSRGTVDGKRGVVVEGATTGLVGVTVTPWIRFPGQSSYSEGKGTRTVDAEGLFAWQRQTGKRIYVIFRAGDIKSNRLVIRR